MVSSELAVSGRAASPGSSLGGVQSNELFKIPPSSLATVDRVASRERGDRKSPSSLALLASRPISKLAS